MRKKISKLESENQSIGIEDVLKSGIKKYGENVEEPNNWGIFEITKLIYSLYEKIKNKRYFILIMSTLFTSSVAIYYHLGSPEYITRFTILPIGSKPNQIASLAAQVGVTSKKALATGYFPQIFFLILFGVEGWPKVYYTRILNCLMMTNLENL